eukprot:SAG31_NODE_39235_length_290_cov_0.303665_2_plen_21_part_01
MDEVSELVVGHQQPFEFFDGE